jgi:hypothetical protein
LEENESTEGSLRTDRVYGGVLAAYVSTTIFCFERNEESFNHVVISCEEGISVGSLNQEDGAEQLPICWQPDTCTQEVTQCTNTAADPCQDTFCRVAPNEVITRGNGGGGGGSVGKCAVGIDELGDDYLPESLWNFAEPYIIERSDLERDLRVAAQLFFDED